MASLAWRQAILHPVTCVRQRTAALDAVFEALCRCRRDGLRELILVPEAWPLCDVPDNHRAMSYSPASWSRGRPRRARDTDGRWAVAGMVTAALRPLRYT